MNWTDWIPGLLVALILGYFVVRSGLKSTEELRKNTKEIRRRRRELRKEK